MIVGTAGHIDHGKTSLVRSLTGVDTDRLKEEKARGISIELGYAYQPLDDGRVLGFVDVPGHERLVHTMLAGATGIDFALLVIAADDGVMPQTREHMQILELLGVPRGAVALTKIDRAEPERVLAVEEEIRELLAPTPLHDAPIFRVANPTGEGIDALREHLAGEAVRVEARAPRGHFRLAVDRSFSLPGAGTVVTGTVFAGEVKVDDELLVSPEGSPVRVRSIHAQNRAAKRGQVGERCALNLSGISREAVARGDWILARPIHAPATRLDVRLRLLPGEKRPFRQWSSVHLHLGAVHVTARVALLEGDELQPGQSGLAQVVLDRPIGALRGDLFVLRDASATRTVAGGSVIDPFGPARHRRSERRMAMLAAMTLPEPTAALGHLLPLSPAGLDVNAFARAWNLLPGSVVLGDGTVAVKTADAWLAFARDDWAAWKDKTLEGLRGFKGGARDELGPELQRLRRMVAPQMAVPAWQQLVDELVKEGKAARSGPLVHLPERRIAFSPAEQVLVQKALPILTEGGFDPPFVRELAQTLRAPEPQLRSLLLRLMKQGAVFQVVQDLFYPTPTVQRLARIAEQLEKENGGVLAAQFRDRTELGRKRAIQILEFFDRVGFTRRVRDEHRLRGSQPFGENEANGSRTP